MGHDGACPSIFLEGAALSAPDRVVDQQQTQCDREQIEKAIVAGERDHDLKKNQKRAGNQTRAARRPDEKWDDYLDTQTCGYGKMFEPFRSFVRVPGEDCRQRLRPVMIVERRHRAPMQTMINPAP